MLLKPLAQESKREICFEKAAVVSVEPITLTKVVLRMRDGEQAFYFTESPDEIQEFADKWRKILRALTLNMAGIA